MNFILEYLKTEEFLLISFFINIFLVVLVSVLTFLVISHRKKYIKFMDMIGKEENLDNTLKKYINEIKCVKDENEQIKSFCSNLDKDIDKAIQKVGIVKYNAFDNITGNLSFAIALLDRKNDGIIINGIYGFQSSNIYSKPIEKGESKYQLSEEEKEALNKAINK